MNLKQMLPDLMPSAIAFAEDHSRYIGRAGKPLSDSWLKLAKSVGVVHPEEIRIAVVDEIPMPQDERLQQLALETGVIGPHTAGLTLGYGIYLVEKAASARLVSHELRHVHQYEAYGSISAFLEAYLNEVAEFGYENAPLELDARAHEIHES